MGATRVEEATEEPARKAPPKDEWAPGHRSFKQNDEGRCHFLGDDNLCEMQNDYGKETLTQVCTLYPRHQHQFSQRLERSATLACPEAARLCLLSDNAMDLVEFEPSARDLLSRPRIYPEAQDDEKMQTFDLVRGAMVDILGDTSLPLGDRLCLLLVMSESGQTLLQSGDRSKLAGLEELVTGLGSSAVRSALLESVSGIRARGTAVNVVISHILCGHDGEVSGRMAALTKGVLKQYSLSGLALDGALDDETFNRVCRRYEELRTASSTFHERIEGYFTRYAQNYIIQEPYVDQPDLEVYLGELVLRLASLRFLFISDPRTVTLCTDDSNRETANELDRVAVEVFRSFAREIEHTPAISRQLHGLLGRLKANAFGDFVCLTRL